MAIFEKSIEDVLKYEGSYIFDKDDRGGETNFGISKKQYPDIDIKNLTVIQAKGIYKKDYWDKMKLDNIFNQKIADKIFDTGVNMGINRAIKITQEACNLLDSYLAIDGLIGSKTITAINSNHQKVLLKLIIFLRISKYLDIIEDNSSQKKFLKGWIIRA